MEPSAKRGAVVGSIRSMKVIRADDLMGFRHQPPGGAPLGARDTMVADAFPWGAFSSSRYMTISSVNVRLTGPPAGHGGAGGGAEPFRVSICSVG